MNVVDEPRPRSDSPSRSKRRSGVVTPHQPTWLQRAAAWMIYLASRTVARTLRYSWNDSTGVLTNPSQAPTIFAIWHNRLALCTEAYRIYERHSRRKGMAALVSASKDGAFLAGILRHFRIHAVRGSSSRRGSQALLELTSLADRGYDLAITPDGPRGPCYSIQNGILSLAQITGMPIVPFAYNVRWCVRLGSWDRFVIPLPFSRCEMNVGKPISIPRDATDEERDAFRQQLHAALMEITRD